MDKRGEGEGVSRFSVEKLSSHSTKKKCRRTLRCFRQFLVSKNFMDERGRKEGVITIFRRKFVVSQNLVGEPFGVSEKFGHQKILCIRGGRRVLRFSVEKVLSLHRNVSKRNPCFRKMLVSKNIKN